MFSKYICIIAIRIVGVVLCDYMCIIRVPVGPMYGFSLFH